MVFKIKKLTESEKQLKLEFKNKLTRENSKRLVIMLGLIISFQVLLLVIHYIGAIIWTEEIIFTRFVLIVSCTFFSLVLTRIRKATEKSGKTKLLSTLNIAIHTIIMTFGAYFTFYLFSIEIYTFDTFIVTTLLVALTHIKWPMLFNAIIIVTVIFMTTYFGLTYAVPDYFADEAHTVILTVILITAFTALIYRARWKLFLREKKINEMNSKLIELSEKDELTGLYNRRRVIERIEESIKQSDRYSTEFCVAMIDLDHFKLINDEYGHNMGDKLLRSFSDILKQGMRESDMLGRWGGEEFIIIINNTKKEGSFALIDRIRQQVEEFNFGLEKKITFSAGICEYVKGMNDDELIGNADYALYLSKQLGRNKVSIYKSA